MKKYQLFLNIFIFSLVAIKFNLKFLPKNIFLQHCYYNDYFKLVKLVADSLLIGVVITNWDRILQIK